MKRVIDGKLYNTETAEEIASFCSGQCGDFNFYEAIMYRTKKGALFLYESGGPFSKMGESNGKESYGTSALTVLNTDQALSWANENSKELAASESEAIFTTCGKKVIEA